MGHPWRRIRHVSIPSLRKILVVDHARETRSIVGFALGNLNNFQVITCESGPEALQLAPAFAPDLLLMDVGMPGMDGIHTVMCLREAGVKAPVVFFTSHLTTEDLERYRSLGAIGTIAKPFNPLHVVRKLKEMWRLHHTRVSAA